MLKFVASDLNTFYVIFTLHILLLLGIYKVVIFIRTMYIQ